MRVFFNLIDTNHIRCCRRQKKALSILAAVVLRYQQKKALPILVAVVLRYKLYQQQGEGSKQKAAKTSLSLYTEMLRSPYNGAANPSFASAEIGFHSQTHPSYPNTHTVGR